jgi:hypothetical protein
MTQNRYVDPANELLSAGLVASGHDVSTRRIERMRSAGLLPSPSGGSGARNYPPEARNAVLDILDLKKKGLTYSTIAAILFWRGYPIDIEVLRSSYLTYSEAGLKALRKSHPSDDEFEIAESAGLKLASRQSRTRIGREWKARLQGRDESARSILQSIDIVMLLTFLRGSFPYAEPHREQVLREFVEASGLAAAERDRIGSIGPLTDRLPLDELGDVFELLSVDAIGQAVASSSVEDLARTRDSFKTLSSFTRCMAEFLTRVSGLVDAMGFGPMATFTQDEETVAMIVPLLRALEVRFPDLVDHDQIQDLQMQLEVMQARLLLLDSIPPKFWPLMAEGERALDALTPDASKELKSALDRFEKEHPEELALALSEVA